MAQAKKEDTLLSKLLGTLSGVAFAGLGVYTVITPGAFSTGQGDEPRRAKARLFYNSMHWLIDHIGNIPSGLILVALGGLIVFAVWSKARPTAPGAAPT